MMNRALAIVVGLAFSGLAACGSAQRPAASISPAAPVSPRGTANPAVVEWLPLPASNQQINPESATPVPPVAIPAGTPTCTAAQLEVGRGASSGATGHVNQPIVFRNRTSSACVLQGYPDLAVIAADGQTLAEGAGTTNRGTFFLDGPAVPVLIQPGTAPLKSMYDPTAPVGTPGQAYVNIEWWDCQARTAERLLVSLGDGAGQLSLAFLGRAPVSPACGATATATSYLARGPFDPSGFPWPPPPEVVNIAIAIAAPATVRRGTALDYTVTLTNQSNRAYRLFPCPDYFEFVGGKLARSTFALNCGPVGAIAPGGSAAFAMRMEIPATISAGLTEIRWGVMDGRVANSYGTASIQIME